LPETIFRNIRESKPFEVKPRSIFDLRYQTLSEPNERLEGSPNHSEDWVNAGSTPNLLDQTRNNTDADSSERDRFADSDPGTTYHGSEETQYTSPERSEGDNSF
jgi:hypothetical protein